MNICSNNNNSNSKINNNSNNKIYFSKINDKNI